MKVAVFFTWDYSINTWYENKTIDREIEFFKQFEDKYQVDFVYFTYGNKQDRKLGEKLKIESIFPIFNKFKYNKNKIIRFLISFSYPFRLKKEIKDIDVMYQNQLLGCWIPIIIKKIYNIPLVMRTGYDMLDFAKNDKKPKLLILLFKILTYLAVSNCDYFTVTSKTDYKNFIAKYPRHKEKFLYRPNWVSVTGSLKFQSRNKEKILAVGRLVSQKNYYYLIEEFKNTNDFLEIDIVGSGEDKVGLENFAKNSNVKLNILNNMPNNELLELYKNYRYFVSTSVFEGNPKTLLEAMASGCVVFASNIENHKELISDKENGFLFNLSKNSLKEKFNMAKHDNELLQNISNNAIKEIKNNNSLNSSIELFYQDFLDVTENTFDK